MKKLTYISLLLFILVACEKETEGVSSIFHFELKGEQTLLVPLGTSYDEPGVVVTYKGEDVSGKVQVSGEVDAKTVGLYSVSYTYTNPDGIKTTRTRSVIVADPNVKTDISGKYKTADGTQRLRQGTTTPYPGFNVAITKIAPGFFEVSDFLGGYYEQRAGYGAAAAMKGYIQLKNDNSIVLLSSHINAWGDGLSSLDNATCTPETGLINWVAQYAGMSFTVVLNKQ